MDSKKLNLSRFILIGEKAQQITYDCTCCSPPVRLTNLEEATNHTINTLTYLNMNSINLLLKNNIDVVVALCTNYVLFREIGKLRKQAIELIEKINELVEKNIELDPQLMNIKEIIKK